MTDEDEPQKVVKNSAVSVLTEDVESIRDRLRERFKATEVDVNTHADGINFRLEFRGFSDLETALERISEVAVELDRERTVESVDLSVNTSGMYDPEADEQDERPGGWVSATATDES